MSNKNESFSGDSTPHRISNKFIIGGVIMLAAVILLIATSLNGNTQYYMTVNELISGQANRTRNIRVSGVVLGDTIQYDPNRMNLTFTVVHISSDSKEIESMGGLEKVLHDSIHNPNLARIKVIYYGEQPDLLKNEAQVIMTGSLGDDGVFYADELLLKCPSRYEENLPNQAVK